ERRRDIHARVVDAIEQLYTDRLGEQVERLAHHAMRGEKREKAVHYLWQAGGKAVARSALSDARTWFEQALGVLDALPRSRAALEQAFEIRLELRRVLRQLGEGRTMLECLREAEALAEGVEDDRRRGPRTFRYGRAAVGLWPRLLDHEPRRARQIRRSGPVRGGGDPNRRTNAACVHDRLGLFRCEHAAPRQRRLGEGALTGRTLDRDASHCKRRHASSLGGSCLRLGTGPAWRGGRGLEPGPGGRAAPRPSGGAGDRRPSRLGVRRGGSRLSAARPA